MGLRINTNIQSLSSQRNLREVGTKLNSTMEKLSSGSRINKAGDDAAGLAISEKMKANIRGSKQAGRNAGDGISMIQTAEGGLNEVSSILIRLRELSIQSASDTVGEEERSFSNMEFQQLMKEVDRIANVTSFNNKNLLNGQGETMDFQIGIQNDPTNDRISYEAQNVDVLAESMGIGGINVATKEDSQENLAKLDAAITHVSGNRASLGALQNRLQSTIRNLDIKTENLAAANSRIRDTDIAVETAALAKYNILKTANISVLAQANTTNNIAMKLIG